MLYEYEIYMVVMLLTAWWPADDYCSQTSVQVSRQCRR